MDRVARNEDGGEERQPDEVVPVKMSEEQVDLALPLPARSLHHVVAEQPDAAAPVDDELGLLGTDLQAWRVSAIATFLIERQGAPKLVQIAQLTIAAFKEFLKKRESI